MSEQLVPENPLDFIVDAVRGGRVLWTYHVNMRLAERSIPRTTILEAISSYEIIESYPDDKYLPSYLVFARERATVFHVLFGTDVLGNNVRVITAYYPSKESWKDDLKTRRA